MTDDTGTESDDESIDELIRQFNNKHDLNRGSQILQLTEELGELAEALHRGDMHEAREECADVEFVARSIALLCGDDIPEETLREKTLYNLGKSESKDGQKVTDDADETVATKEKVGWATYLAYKQGDYP